MLKRDIKKLKTETLYPWSANYLHTHIVRGVGTALQNKMYSVAWKYTREN